MSRNAKRERETLAPEEVISVDRYVPDYESKCRNCGESPTVLGSKNGKIVYASGLCGPCTWGDSECIDPGNW